jgi:hypothetical protein
MGIASRFILKRGGLLSSRFRHYPYPVQRVCSQPESKAPRLLSKRIRTSFDDDCKRIKRLDTSIKTQVSRLKTQE